MANNIITVRVKPEDKKDFEKFCDNTGMNPSVAINIFIKAVLRENKIPFEITDQDNFYSKENVDFILNGVKALDEGKGVEHELHELKEE